MRATSAKCALSPSLICTPPNFLMTSIPRRRLNPNGLLFTTSTFILRDICWSLLKLCCQHHGLEGTHCLLSELRYFSILQVDITFHSQWMKSSWNPPMLSDHSIDFHLHYRKCFFEFMWGRVVPASCPLLRFPDTLKRYVLVAGTDNRISPEHSL